jgi:hypothetical protein
MKKTLVAGCGLALSLILVGCGSSGVDAVVQEQISVMNETAAILENAKSGKTADAQTRMEKLRSRTQELQKQLKGLPENEVKAAVARHKDALSKAVQRLAMAGLGQMPGNVKGFLKTP